MYVCMYVCMLCTLRLTLSCRERREIEPNGWAASSYTAEQTLSHVLYDQRAAGPPHPEGASSFSSTFCSSTCLAIQNILNKFTEHLLLTCLFVINYRLWHRAPFNKLNNCVCSNCIETCTVQSSLEWKSKKFVIVNVQHAEDWTLR